MLRHLLAAAWRNLRADRLHAAVGVAGLAFGAAAVILAGLYVASELAYDGFIPGADEVFVVTSDLRMPGQAPVVTDYAPGWIAGRLRASGSPPPTVARLVYDRLTVSHGEIAAREEVAWVDPGFFQVLPLPALAGDPAAALARPDGVVITRAAARRYFGRDAPLGETLDLDGAGPLQVGAVLRDLPPETHLGQELFAAGTAPFSRLARLEAQGGTQRGFATWLVTPRPGQHPAARFETVRMRTYVRAASPGARKALAAALAPDRLGPLAGLPDGSSVRFDLTPLRALHLQAFRGASLGAAETRSSRGALAAIGAAAGMVLVLAVINFVNLATARGARRAVEVGVRKAAGAQRRHLVLQFIGEGALQVLCALVLALALVEVSLPWLNAFLGKALSFPYWRDPRLLAGLLAGAAALSVLAGAYPALVLSAFRPATVLKGGPVAGNGSGRLREALVAGQFAVLIVLILAVIVVWRQTRFAMEEGLKLDTDQILTIEMTPCRTAFETEVRRLPGVTGAACSSVNLLDLDSFDPVKFVMDANLPGGPTVHADVGVVDYGWFELYGIEPLAGRLFSRRHAIDEQKPQDWPKPQHGTIVLNESAVRKLGLPAPQSAIGRRVAVGPGLGEFDVVGVVPDATLNLKSAPVKPTVFMVDFINYPADQVLSVRLDGRRLAETTGAIDRLWRRTGQAGAIQRRFLDDYVRQLYRTTLQQGLLAAALGALALLLAGLGLFALSAFTAERRTKEIGVRKAMGASSAQVFRLLLWRFARPVLIAWAAACPIGWWLMRRWLDGFAYRIELSAWIFLAAGAAALAVAGVTVGGHALAIARRRPVQALRYE
ncbi:MAG: FtsX-like permease family protein [Phenylobacterium sp.]|uniref:FtsX-like permease family protein n=1 Tax=Phenylobacterium sp. TaxID=1871053 RepID=UPI00391CBC63